jgi:hypothetical protein
LVTSGILVATGVLVTTGGWVATGRVGMDGMLQANNINAKRMSGIRLFISTPFLAEIHKTW